MPSYDPQRSRPRRRVADDEGPAPVDALLGGTPADPLVPDVPPVADTPSGALREPLVIDLDRPGPAAPGRGRRRLLLPLVAVVAIVIEVAAWRWWRRRAAASGDQG